MEGAAAPVSRATIHSSGACSSRGSLTAVHPRRRWRLSALVASAFVLVASGQTSTDDDQGNPFKDKAMYVNPWVRDRLHHTMLGVGGKVRANLEKMLDIPSAFWIDTKSKIRGNTTETLEGILKDSASKKTPEMVVFIWYNLPNRDCHAFASRGEICCKYNADKSCNYTWQEGGCFEGIREYKETYVNPFVEVLQKYQDKVPVALVIEPDSLPNLVTNTDNPRCGGKATYNAYKDGIAYAVTQLVWRAPKVAIYLDAAHGGWLGWNKYIYDLMYMVRSMDVPIDKVRGFSTNVANYQPLGYVCPYEPDLGTRNGYCLGKKKEHQSEACCNDPCGLTAEWNPGNNELNYAQDLVATAHAVFGTEMHAIIDTGRNGGKGKRLKCSNWCNVRGAGAGIAFTTNTGAPEMVDAYIWLKTPGESDGCTKTLPDGKKCPRFDLACSSPDSIGGHSDEPRAPEAGAWFDYQAKQLGENAELTRKERLVEKPTEPEDQEHEYEEVEPDEEEEDIEEEEEEMVYWQSEI